MRGSFAAALLLVALLPGSALAGTVSKRDGSGEVRVRGLSAKERKALDIRSVTLSGDESLGIFATVTFAGNITNLIGRGHLRRATAELVLQPASPGLAAARLITKGPGIIGTTVRRTKSKKVGVIRQGRKLSFFVLGPGFSKVASAEVRVLLPGGATATASQEKPPADTTGPVVVPKAELSCEELLDELERLALALDKARTAKTKAEKAVVKAEKALADGEPGPIGKAVDLFNKLFGGPPTRTESRAGLKKSVARLKMRIENFEDTIIILEAERAVIKDKIRKCKAPPPPAPKTLGAAFGWQNFGEGEVKGVGRFLVREGQQAGARAADANSPLDSVSVVIPPSGSSARQITNYLCPTQLPTATLATTTNPNDTLTCTGGSLPVGQDFTLNVRTTPAPSAGMGGQLYARQDGAVKGPFSITGP